MPMIELKNILLIFFSNLDATTNCTDYYIMSFKAKILSFKVINKIGAQIKNP
jgi:hypothetical protein